MNDIMISKHDWKDGNGVWLMKARNAYETSDCTSTYTPTELEERFRYSTNNSHWIEYHNDDEENARKFEERFVNHKVTEQEKRDARIELIL